MLELALSILLGLAIGSFLNVVIERCPRMMELEWLTHALALAREQGWTPPDGAKRPRRKGRPRKQRREQGWMALARKQGWTPPDGAKPEAPATLSLASPGSHCPKCSTPIRWHHNLPLLGFLLLRGRCHACGQTISWQYPVVELATAVWFGCACWWWGPTVVAGAWMAWGAALIALAVIDARTQYLPDDLTQPLCWAGLLAASFGLIAVDLSSALLGAVAGYLLLWVVAQVFWRLTGKEGMGQGDFKLLAALGAWLGWQSLSALILPAAVLGMLHGLVRMILRPQAEPHFPFGPSLCAAAFALVVWGRGQPVWLVF